MIRRISGAIVKHSLVRSRGPGSRSSVIRGALERCRWILASASLRARPPAGPKAADLEGLRETGAALDAQRARLDQILAGEEQQLARWVPSAPVEARGSWATAATLLTDEIAALEASAKSPTPEGRSSAAALSKIEGAAMALENTVAALHEQQRLLEARAAKLQERAEAAVTAGDDAAAMRALARKKHAEETLSAIDRELAVREQIVSEWRRVIDLFGVAHPSRK